MALFLLVFFPQSQNHHHEDSHEVYQSHSFDSFSSWRLRKAGVLADERWKVRLWWGDSCSWEGCPLQKLVSFCASTSPISLWKQTELSVVAVSIPGRVWDHLTWHVAVPFCLCKGRRVQWIQHIAMAPKCVLAHATENRVHMTFSSPDYQFWHPRTKAKKMVWINREFGH